MNIKTKLILIGIVFVVAVFLFGGAIFFINQESFITENKKTQVDELIFTVFERNVFFNDYLLGHADRAKQQLMTRNTDIGNRIKELMPLLTDQGEINEVRYIRDVNHAFITANIESLLAQEKELTLELRSRMVSGISIKSQSTVRIAQQLGQAYQNKLEGLRLTLNALMISFGFLSLIFIVVATTTIFSILRSIARLNKGANEIAKGNLMHRITIQTRDELGVVSDTFNNMAEELRASYDKIKESKELLEDRVQAQTTELSQKVALLEQFKVITEEREHKMIELKNQLSRLESENQK